MFGRDLLGRIREGAFLVNAARGAVVETGALADRRIRADLDTTDSEPLPEEHPLWASPGAFITSHTAGNTHGFPERVYRLVSEQISRYASGEELVNVVHGGY